MEIDAGAARGVFERRERHHRRAVLIVVQHRYGQPLAQQPLDLEAFGRSEVLELDGAERARDAAHDVGDAFRLGLGQEDRHAVEPGELGKERRLAFHHGQPRERADVAKPQDRGAVGDDGHGAPQRGVFPGRRRVLLDGEAHPRDARRVHVAQHLLRVDGGTRHGADLAAAVAVEYPVGLADEARDRQLTDALVE